MAPQTQIEWHPRTLSHGGDSELHQRLPGVHCPRTISYTALTLQTLKIQCRSDSQPLRLTAGRGKCNKQRLLVLSNPVPDLI